MTASAVALLVVAIVLLWGGLVVAVVALRARPELESYPPGGEDDVADDVAPSSRGRSTGAQ